jgi:hypothetical protein
MSPHYSTFFSCNENNMSPNLYMYNSTHQDISLYGECLLISCGITPYRVEKYAFYERQYRTLVPPLCRWRSTDILRVKTGLDGLNCTYAILAPIGDHFYYQKIRFPTWVLFFDFIYVYHICFITPDFVDFSFLCAWCFYCMNSIDSFLIFLESWCSSSQHKSSSLEFGFKSKFSTTKGRFYLALFEFN